MIITSQPLRGSMMMTTGNIAYHHQFMAKKATTIRFQAKLMKPAEGGDWCFLRLPQEASDQVPTRATKFAEGTLNGAPFAAFLQPDSEGGHWMRIENGTYGVSAGQTVELEITPVDHEPETEVPDDLRQALDASPAALEAWQSTTTVARRDWITWMAQGRRAETRTIRLNKMIDMLGKGKRRVCCYDRSGMASKEFVCPTPAPDELPIP